MKAKYGRKETSAPRNRLVGLRGDEGCWCEQVYLGTGKECSGHLCKVEGMKGEGDSLALGLSVGHPLACSVARGDKILSKSPTGENHPD